MKRAVASLVGLVLASSGLARADEPASIAAPFLTDYDDNVHTATGAFGPAKDTTIVISFDLRGAGSYHGFALVPDAKAKGGQRKLALPRLPAGSLSGDNKIALIANLDADPADELVVELRVMHSVASKEGGYSYGATEYVVLDWNGKQFVRASALETKLAAKMAAREEAKTEPLAEADLRAVLGVAKP